MLRYGVFLVAVGIVTVLSGGYNVLVEPSAWRWLSLLPMWAGVLGTVRGWAALSLHAEQTTGRKPSWGFERFLDKCFKDVQDRPIQR